MRQDQIALQLYTVRRRLATDLPGTLAAVAGAGYRSVELAGLPEVAPEDLAQLLDEAGLAPVASHESMDALRADPDAVAERLRRVGCPRVVVPAMPEADRASVESVRAFAAEMGRLAAALGGHGLRLGYHNHDFEFAPIDGTTAFDVLLSELPPTVELEVDVYWVSVGGGDPVAAIRAAQGRVRMLHMKDRAEGEPPRDAPAGSGVLDMPAVVEAGRAARVHWYIAEQDHPGDEIDDITTAAWYLRSLAG
jgi:sugar phosphate isomerase/epimerase